MNVNRKTTPKRLLSMLLVLMMVLTLLPTTAFAADPLPAGPVLTWDEEREAVRIKPNSELPSDTRYYYVIWKSGRSVEGRHLQPGQWALTTDYLETGDYEVEVWAKDAAGNQISEKSSITFHKNNEPPTVALSQDGSCTVTDVKPGEKLNYSLRVWVLDSAPSLSEEYYHSWGNVSNTEDTSVSRNFSEYMFPGNSYSVWVYNENGVTGYSNIITVPGSYGSIKNIKYFYTGIVTWDAVEGIDKYDRYAVKLFKKNQGNYGMVETNVDVLTPEISLGRFQNPLEAGEYEIRIIACKGISDNVIAIGTYQFSVDEAYTPQNIPLPAPTNLRWEGQTAKWDAVSNAAGYCYNIYKDNMIISDGGLNTTTTVRSNEADMSEIIAANGPGSYTFEVYAWPTIAGYEKGEFSVKSPELRYYPRLDAPTDPDWNGQTAKCTAVPGVSTYGWQLYKDGTKADLSFQTSTNEADMSELIADYGAGTYTFAVWAVSNDANKRNSSSVMSGELTVGFVDVTGITDMPTSIAAGEKVVLPNTAQVTPANATNKVISWTITEDGGTLTTLYGNHSMSARNAGTVKLSATIENGKSTGAYTQEFTVTVTAAGSFETVSNHTSSAGAGQPISWTFTPASGSSDNYRIILEEKRATGTVWDPRATDITSPYTVPFGTAGTTGTYRLRAVEKSTYAAVYSNEFTINWTAPSGNFTLQPTGGIGIIGDDGAGFDVTFELDIDVDSATIKQKGLTGSYIEADYTPIPANTVKTINGKHFGGTYPGMPIEDTVWYVEAVKGGATYTSQEFVVQWARNANMYNVSVDNAGGEGTVEVESPVQSGMTIILPECTLTPPTGAQFTGWKINGEFTGDYGKPLQPGDEEVIGTNTVLSPAWEYTISDIAVAGLDAPEADKKLDFTATATSVSGQNKIQVNSIVWKDETEDKIYNGDDLSVTFKDGHTYHAEITVKATDANKFLQDTSGKYLGTAAVTEHQVDPKTYNEALVIGYTLTKIYTKPVTIGMEASEEQYTVTYNTQGKGTAPASIVGLDAGSKLTMPTAPTAEGFAFGGWYKEAACTNAWNFGTDTVTSNITLYAKWTEVIKYNITVNPATNGTVTSDMSTAAEGEIVQLTVASDSGYEIDTLTVTQDGIGIYVNIDNSFIMPNEDVVVNATFKEKATTTEITAANITVTAPKTGATPSSATTSDTAYTVASTSWEPTDSPFKADTAYTVTINLEAAGPNKFTENTKFYINGNEATLVSPNPITGNVNQVRVSYTFPKTEADPGGGTTTTYTVTFDANGGTCGTTTATTGTDGKLASLPTATRSGSYSFKGWYTATSGGKKITTDDVFSADTTVYAQWTYTGGGSGGGGGTVVTTKYTLTFNTNGGSKIDSISKTSGTTVNLASYKPTKDGYTFDGWYSDKKLTEKVTSVKLTKDTTVYAKWETKNPDTGAGLPFIDVKSGDWFYDDVAYVFEKGLMNGTSSTTFSPNMTTTRGMIVTVLYRQAGSPTVSGNCPFNDVKSGMYYEAPIAWAAANGIVKGYSADKFGPDDPITREQMAAILYRYAQHKGIDVSAKADLSKYNDAAKVSDWAKDAIAWTVKEGIFNGVGDDLLSPETQATRAQIAAILHRFCENIAK